MSAFLCVPHASIIFHLTCVGNGTIDWAPYLTVADGLVSSLFFDPLLLYFLSTSFLLALEFRKWLGGEHKINAYCHNLAIEGGKRLAEMWGTRLMDPTGEFTLNMVCHLIRYNHATFLSK